MRDFKGMKRQRGRNRKPGGHNANNANPNRSWDSQGPENIKVRGNAQTVYERYQQLARDAASAGDRVLAENYLQHAEHYFRVLRALQPQRPVSEIAARELSNQGFDIDFEDETGAQAAAFLAAQQAAERAAQPQGHHQGQHGGVPDARASIGEGGPEAQSRSDGDERPRHRDRDRDEPRGDLDGGPRRETRRERWERRQEERARRFEAQAQDDRPEGGDVPLVEESAEPEPSILKPTPTADVTEDRPEPSRPPRRPRAPRDRAGDHGDAPAPLPGFLTRAPASPRSIEDDAAPQASEDAAPRRRSTRRRVEAPAPEEG